MSALPAAIDALVGALAQMPGVVGVALGGSRAAGVADATSDWDLAVYYRGALELGELAARGEVHPPGAWGRIMNGGAWLTIDGAKVDVLLRDLDVALAWSARAEEGVYEVDALLGYLAGVPTYSLLAERAVGRTLRGALPAAGAFPERLAETATERWRFSRSFTLMHARMRAERGDVVGAAGQVAKAVVEEAHARLCERREWVLNEKRIVERAGLASLHERLARTPREPAALLEWVAGVERALATR